MNEEDAKKAGAESEALNMYRRIDTLLWIGIAALMLFAGSTLWDLKIETVRMAAKVDGIEERLSKMSDPAVQLEAVQLRIARLEDSLIRLYPWRRAAHTDINTVFRKLQLGEPTINTKGDLQ